MALLQPATIKGRPVPVTLSPNDSDSAGGAAQQSMELGQCNAR